MALFKFEDGKISLSEKDISPMINGPYDTEKDPTTAGIFTTIMVKETVPVFYKDHKSRLFENAQDIGVNLSKKDKNSIDDITQSIIQKSDEKKYGIRLVIWNIQNSNFDINQDFTVYPFYFHIEDSWYDKGISVKLSGEVRPNAHIKSVFWTNSFDAENSAAKEGYQETILMEGEKIREGARSNIYWVYDGKIETPNIHILKGVTREKILEICEKESIQVSKGDYSSERLYDADEAFISGTTKKIIPIVKANNTMIGDGIPGELTKLLMIKYGELIKSYIHKRKR